MNPTNVPHIFHHFMPTGLPNAELSLKSATSEPVDLEVCERLATSYQKAMREQTRLFPTISAQDMWDVVKDKHYVAFHELLMKGDAKAIAKELTNGIRAEFAFGLGSGPGWFQRASDVDTAPAISAIILDRLVAVCEALGVIPLENPEHKPWGANIYIEPEDLCAGLEKKLGISISNPSHLGLFGIRAGDRLITVRTPDFVYTASLLHRVGTAASGRKCLEIGGGFGGCAYFSALLGCEKHDIFDLPMVSVLQGFFLCKSLGLDKVRLFGEADRGQVISLLPNWEIQTAKAQGYDIAFSQDVLPELHGDRISEYLREIQRVTRYAFVTINHENPYEISGYSQESGEHREAASFRRLLDSTSGLVPLSRAPYWIRKGYVEEIYLVRQS
jgi:hypothetical protein